MNQTCKDKISSDSNFLKKKSHRKEFIYDKVDNFKRAELLRLLQEEKKTLKESSEILKINYSTAKTIIRVYRKEQRIFKKSSLKEEAKLTILKKEENSTSAIFNTKSSNISVCENVFQINKMDEISKKQLDNSTDMIPGNCAISPNIFRIYTFLSEKINRDLLSYSRIINQVYYDIRENQTILENLLNFTFQLVKKMN